MSRTNEDQRLRIWKTVPREWLRQFKLECLRLINDLEITQEEVASACGVHPSTVSRWFDLDGDMQFPLAFIPCLNTERLFPLAQGMLQYVAVQIDLSISRRLRVKGCLDGSIKNETLDIVEQVGKLADAAKQECKLDFSKIRDSRNTFLRIVEVAQRGVDELNVMEIP